MALYTTAQRHKFVGNALKAADAHANAKSSIRIGSGATAQTLKLDAQVVNGKVKGYCARFVRQVAEATFGLGDRKWMFGAASAKQMGDKMRANHLSFVFNDGAPHVVVGSIHCPLQPGDVLVWQDEDSGAYGHVAIYLGDVYGDGRKLVAENTSSAKRGFPRRAGTKITQLRNMRPAWAAYRMFPTEAS